MAITASIKTSSAVSEAVANGSAAGSLTGGPALNISLTSGTGANQVDLYWEVKGVTVAAGSSVTYTLSALTDGLGRVVNFARVKDLLVDLTDSTNTAGDFVNIGGAATQEWTAIVGAAGDLVVARVGGFLHLVAPGATAYVVTSGSADKIKVANPGAHAIKASFYFKGCSA